MDLVSQVADQAGGNLKEILASADSAVTRLWQNCSAVSSSPAAQPPAGAQAVEGDTGGLKSLMLEPAAAAC